MEKLVKEGKIRTDDEEVDDLETASQEKEKKGNRRSQRQGKRSQKQEKVNVACSILKHCDHGWFVGNLIDSCFQYKRLGFIDQKWRKRRS
jgi:hypothetical protein